MLFTYFNLLSLSHWLPLSLLCSLCLRVSFHSVLFLCFVCQILHISEIIHYLSLSLTYFTQHNALQVHPYCFKWQNFILFMAEQYSILCVCWVGQKVHSDFLYHLMEHSNELFFCHIYVNIYICVYIDRYMSRLLYPFIYHHLSVDIQVASLSWLL